MRRETAVFQQLGACTLPLRAGKHFAAGETALYVISLCKGHPHMHRTLAHACMQVPRACTRQSDGLWAKREAQRNFSNLVRRELRCSELQRMHALPTHRGGPPTFCDADASHFRGRGARAAAQLRREAAELQQRTCGARAAPVATQDGLWQDLQRQEWGRAARLQEVAAEQLAGVEGRWARRAAAATPFAAAPFEGSYEDNITCTWRWLHACKHPFFML